jgi:hypothetical protein
MPIVIADSCLSFFVFCHFIFLCFFFLRFSKDHAFEKPNDKNALELMDACATAMLEKFPDIVFAYGVSDEYRYMALDILSCKSVPLWNFMQYRIPLFEYKIVDW